MGYEAAPAVVLKPARDPCCGPCYCHHTRLSWQLALSPGGFHLRAYLGKRRSRRREPGCPSLGTAAYQGKALGSRSTIRQRSRCCLSCLQAIYVTHPGPGPTMAPPHKTKSNPWGFKRGVPLLWLFVHFGQSKWTPAERPWKGAGFHLGNRRKTSPAERVSPRQRSNFAPEKWGEEQAPKANTALRA